MRVRKLASIFPVALLLATGSAQAATDRSPEAELARAVEGRVAGKPVDCINLRDIRSSRIIDRSAIVYEVSGGTKYVNRPTSGAPSMRSGLTLVTDTHSSRLCSIDVVRLYDSTSRMELGSVGLGKFVPYSKPPRP